MIANTETKAFIEVKMKRELTETEYDKKWEDLSMIYERPLNDYFYGLAMKGDPSSEDDYKRAVDESVKYFMDIFTDIKTELGKEGGNKMDHTAESVKAFLTTPIATGNLKKGYFFFVKYKEENGYGKYIKHYYPIELTSEHPFTYGMILMAYSFVVEENFELYSPCSNGSKLGVSDNHFVFKRDY